MFRLVSGLLNYVFKSGEDRSSDSQSFCLSHVMFCLVSSLLNYIFQSLSYIIFHLMSIFVYNIFEQITNLIKFLNILHFW